MRKKLLRIFIGIVTAPIWITGSILVIVIGAVLSAPFWLIKGIDFAFTGEWE